MKRPILPYVLVTSLVLGALPVQASAFYDMPNDYSKVPLENAIKNGLLSGFSTGSIAPNKWLTRAEMAAIMTRAFGATERASLNGFYDVSYTSWTYDPMSKAVAMGIFEGNKGKLYPNSYISRQEAFAVLARAFGLEADSNKGADGFEDSGEISPWAKRDVAAMVDAGFVEGSDDDYLYPNQGMSRKDFATILDRMVFFYMQEAGEIDYDIEGTLMINKPNVTLKNMTVEEELIVGDGVGSGDLTLDGVTVSGDMLVRGGGEDSIHIKGNSKVGDIKVAKVGGDVRIVAEESATVNTILVNDGEETVYLEGAFKTIEIHNDTPVHLDEVQVDTLNIFSEDVELTVGSDSLVKKMTVDAAATQADIQVNRDATITTLDINGRGAEVSGAGTITTLNIKADDVDVDIAAINVKVDENATGVTVDGERVDSEDEIKTTYTVEFDSDGGTEVDEQTVRAGEEADEPDDPEKDGYDFLGWYDEEDNLYDFDDEVEEDLKLTAKWGVTVEDEESFLDALGNGSVSLDDSFSLSKDITIKENVVIDGEGETIDLDRNQLILNGNGTITIKDLVLEGAGSDYMISALGFTGKLVLENVEFDGYQNGVESDGGSVAIGNSRFSTTSSGTAVLAEGDADVSVDDSIFQGTGSATAIAVKDTAEVELVGNTFHDYGTAFSNNVFEATSRSDYAKINSDALEENVFNNSDAQLSLLELEGNPTFVSHHTKGNIYYRDDADALRYAQTDKIAAPKQVYTTVADAVKETTSGSIILTGENVSYDIVSGTILTIPSGVTLRIPEGVTLNNYGKIENLGKIEGNINNVGGGSVTDGALPITSEEMLRHAIEGTDKVEIGADITLKDGSLTLTAGKTLVVPEGMKLSIANGSGIIVQNNATLDIHTGATVDAQSGTFTVQDGGDLVLDGTLLKNSNAQSVALDEKSAIYAKAGVNFTKSGNEVTLHIDEEKMIAWAMNEANDAERESITNASGELYLALQFAKHSNASNYLVQVDTGSMQSGQATSGYYSEVLSFARIEEQQVSNEAGELETVITVSGLSEDQFEVNLAWFNVSSTLEQSSTITVNQTVTYAPEEESATP